MINDNSHDGQDKVRRRCCFSNSIGKDSAPSQGFRTTNMCMERVCVYVCMVRRVGRAVYVYVGVCDCSHQHSTWLNRPWADTHNMWACMRACVGLCVGEFSLHAQSILDLCLVVCVCRRALARTRRLIQGGRPQGARG